MILSINLINALLLSLSYSRMLTSNVHLLLALSGLTIANKDDSLPQLPLVSHWFTQAACSIALSLSLSLSLLILNACEPLLGIYFQTHVQVRFRSSLREIPELEDLFRFKVLSKAGYKYRRQERHSRRFERAAKLIQDGRETSRLKERGNAKSGAGRKKGMR